MHILDLEYNGIFLSKEPAHEGVLPQHIDRVRAILLDFTCAIDDIESADLHTDGRALVKHYEPIRDEAERLHNGKDREVEWQTFFLINFLRPLENEMRVRDEDKRQRARTKFYYFESAQSRPWTLFGQKTKGEGWNRVVVEKGYRQDERTGLTEPKPDWVAFFPIYDFENERIQTSKRWPLAKDAKKAMIENFELTTLKHLARYGVESNTAALFRKERDEWILSDCICFPWLIVEHKREGGAAVEEKCYCQAANAGTAAVMMLETLFAGERGPNKERNKANEYIPPVVTMTTVDKTVRVWITYLCKPSDHDTAKYRMDCIWKGDMTVALDLIRFGIILENTHTWAMHDQRRRISTYIDLWKLKHPMYLPKTECESTPKYNLFGESWNLAGPTHVGGSQIAASTVDWPTTSNVDFVAAIYKCTESRHPNPRPRKLPLSAFTDGVFGDFAKPGAAKMHLLFTPPASTNSTPLKQQPLRETPPARPRSPSDERIFWFRGLRAALPPTPEPTPDGKSGRGRSRSILDVYSDDEGL